MKLLLVTLAGAALAAAGGLAYLATPPGAASAAESGLRAADFLPAVLPPLLEDALGDAQDEGAGHLAYGGCRLGGCIDVPDVRLAGDHAAPFDIVSAGLVGETESDLLFAISVAELPEGFAHLERGPTNRVGEYGLCWIPAADAGPRCAIHFVSLDGGAVRHAALLGVESEACNDWHVCTYDVSSTVTTGAPGLVEISVPKRLAVADGAPAAIVEMWATTGWHSGNDLVPLWHGAWSFRDGQEHTHDHVGLVEPAVVADVAEAVPVEVAFTVPAARSAADPARVAAAQPGLLWGDGGPRDLPWMDVVGVGLDEVDDETLLVRLELAGLDGLPRDGFHHIVFLSALGGVVHEVGVIKDVDSVFAYAGRCISFGCHDAYAIEVPFTVESGAPGALVLEVPREVLYDVVRGSELSAVWAATSHAEASVYLGKFGDANNANVHSASVADGWFGGVPYVFERGPVEAADGHGHEH